MQDPNKPMYGNKEVVKDVVKDLTRPSESTRPAETKVDIVPVAKPEIKSADVSPKTDVVDDKYIYFLQAGAFREPADAESTRAKLALLGFEARINEKASENGNLYRVRIGPFAQLETMNRIRSKLSENSVDVAVVRTAK
jgi:cell division protein FtsN